MPLMLHRLPDTKATSLKAVQEELARFKSNPEVTVLCSVVTKMREPFAAIARLNDEQVEVMKAAVAAMKR